MPSEKPALNFFVPELTAAQIEELARLAPNVRVVSGLSREQLLERVEEAAAIDAHYLTPEFLARAKHLVWVQAMSAGVDRDIGIEGLAQRESLVLTNLRGVHGPAIADHAFGMLLTLTRDLRHYAAQQAKGVWKRAGSGTPLLALQGRTMLVVGLGGIGTEIAQRAHGFGMRVIATRRGDDPAPSFVSHVGRPGDLMAMLPEADVVALAVPLTPETQGMINAEAFAAMKPSAYLINIARGKVIDSAALISALESKRLAGACLDVTDPEPLPAESPLWRFPNVVITPHMSAESELTYDRGWLLLKENVRRFGAGEPLLNVVDLNAGY
jgi:phosphoglycerate dehydrogenase-like enzyme